ncbi:Os01g0172500 [Oryza sativa Japonica Group]|jgi:hypothetical protein|uniref:Os01g0172500 protein n=1 Tax=Oryza sativa subsp. japonica TaxID=39947 RepID=A0A0P0UYS5_ORYSJ|nr:Os01g0172500 [Oryza sativa Japonica Group]
MTATSRRGASARVVRASRRARGRRRPEVGPSGGGGLTSSDRFAGFAGVEKGEHGWSQARAWAVGGRAVPTSPAAWTPGVRRNVQPHETG